MNEIEILSKQTEDAHNWVNKLINSIPHTVWDVTPEILESNITWQVGHLLMSFYYHSIMVIKGHQMDIIQSMPLKEYDVLFTAGKPGNVVGKIDHSILMSHLMLVEQKSMTVIKSLTLENLNSELVPGPINHPIAKTKFEALDWNIKHAMWHCGQIGILKRIVDKGLDFGLKRQ